MSPLVEKDEPRWVRVMVVVFKVTALLVFLLVAGWLAQLIESTR